MCACARVSGDGEGPGGQESETDVVDPDELLVVCVDDLFVQDVAAEQDLRGRDRGWHEVPRMKGDGDDAFIEEIDDVPGQDVGFLAFDDDGSDRGKGFTHAYDDVLEPADFLAGLVQHRFLVNLAQEDFSGKKSHGSSAWMD